MEWMLQVVDEVDDALCVVKHRWLGLRIELGVLLLLGTASGGQRERGARQPASSAHDAHREIL